MRIRLLSGKQRELIELAKSKNNLSWDKLGKELDASPDYIRNELRNEIRTLDYNLYKRLCILVKFDYDKYIRDKLDDNWGRSKGGKNSVSLPKKPELLVNEESVELAEIIGIILGDGNIYVKESTSNYVVRVCGHVEDDREYLLRYVTDLFEKTFNVSLLHYEHKTHKELTMYKQSKNLVYTLIKFGLMSGNKKQNNQGIPNWIFENNEFLKVCIRGILDTDGSVCPKTRRHPAPSIWLRSAIPKLRKDFMRAMNKLNYHPSKWTNCDVPQCCLGRKEEVIKYIKEIGFSNSKHQNKFNAPVV